MKAQADQSFGKYTEEFWFVLSCLNGSNFLSLYFQNCHMAGKKLKTLTMEHTTLSKFTVLIIM